MPGKIILLVLLIPFFACHLNDRQQTPVLKDKSAKQPIELEVKSFYKTTQQKKDTIICRLALTNNTFRNIQYLAMSCAYTDVYCTDFPGLRPVVEECNKNAPTLYTLGFYESDVRQVAFCYDAASNIPTHIPVRFGFHFIKTNYIPATDPRILLQDTANIIWSRPIEW